MEETLSKSSGSADSIESADWQLPLCFTDKRHTEEIKSAESVVNSWRLKERVSATCCVRLVVIAVNTRFAARRIVTVLDVVVINFFIFPDENRECCTRPMFECGCRSTRRFESTAVCSSRVLDRYLV